MNKRCKVRAKCICAGLAFLNLFIITFNSNAKHDEKNKSFFLFKDYSDTTKQKKKSSEKAVLQKALNDTTKSNFRNNYNALLADTPRKRLITDTTGNDSAVVQKTDTLDFKISKDTLQGTITYSAEDSGVLVIPKKEFILYGKATTKYTDLELNAGTIILQQEKQLVTAYGTADSAGNPLEKPKLVQAGTTSNSDTIVYNLKTQRGITKSSYLQEGEMFVYAQTVKKVTADVLYAWRGRFTTCNLDTPHFAFRTRKMKIINKKLAVSGPAFPEFEGVPIPIGIPFGIYPLNRGRHSGVLPPTFTSNEDFGLGIEGLGYYKVINDNVDITTRTNIYSYGGWNLNLSSRYLKRYRYSGGLNLALQKTKFLNRAGNSKDEFTQSSTFMIGWNHSRDPKAHPGSNFSASVNAGSTRFNRNVPNNANLNFQNQLSSSINYSKDWRGKYNLTVSANHNQNNQSRLINLNLPTVNFSVITLYPFQKKEQVGTPKWYEKLGIAYTGNLQNQVAFYDSAFSIRRVLDTAQWGATHSIPITLSLPSLGPVQIAPSVSYEEKWYGQKINRKWNDTAHRVDMQTSRGFFTARQMQFGVSANTRIFGTYQFGKNSNIRAIRHEIRPTISLNYKPDLMKSHFDSLQIDTTGRKIWYSEFEGVVGGSYGQGRFGGISFGIDNTLEMKVRNKKDTTEEGATKKVRLIDGFGFSSALNLVADSFKLSTFNLYLRSNLFDKINITATANLDPYMIDNRGFRIDKLMWTEKPFKIGRITNGSIAMSTSFQSKSKDGKTDKQRLPHDEFMTPDEQQRQLDYVRNNPAEYTDFNIPWTVSLSYSLSFNRQFTPDYSKLQTTTYSNISINGDFSLTPRWKIGANSYYDFTTSKIQTLTMFISREMHCWQMSINLTPVGLYRSFNITINPKSGILRDLKVNRSRFFYNQ